jgi:hypothetical protein
MYLSTGRADTTVSAVVVDAGVAVAVAHRRQDSA